MGLYAANGVPYFAAGIARAGEALDSGAAKARLDQFVAATKRLAG